MPQEEPVREPEGVEVCSSSGQGEALEAHAVLDVEGTWRRAEE